MELAIVFVVLMNLAIFTVAEKEVLLQSLGNSGIAVDDGGSSEMEQQHHVLSAISPSTKQQKKDIQELLTKWDNAFLADKNLKQATLIEIKPTKKDPGWRLDSQSNGAFVKFKEDNNTFYQNFAIQSGKLVYSCVIAPLAQKSPPTRDMVVGAFTKSASELKVAVFKRTAPGAGTWQVVMEA